MMLKIYIIFLSLNNIRQSTMILSANINIKKCKYKSMCNVIDDYQDKELSKMWKKIEGNYRFI